MHRFGLPTASLGVRQLSKFTLLGFFIALKNFFHSDRHFSDSSASQSSPSSHSLCSPILDCTTKAAAYPIGIELLDSRSFSLSSCWRGLYSYSVSPHMKRHLNRISPYNSENLFLTGAFHQFGTSFLCLICIS